MSAMGKRDCIFLLADSNMKAVFEGFLTRQKSHLSLGCGPFAFDPRHDLLVDSGGSDPGVYNRGHLLLASYAPRYRHAVVVLDAAWDGSPGAAKIALDLSARLRRDWGDERCAVIVIDPELEAWIWQRNEHVSSAFRYTPGKRSPDEPPPKALWELLEETGDWPKDEAKPPDPKAAVEKVLRMTRTPRSGAVYRKVVERVSLQGCTDPAFAALRTALQRWFPAEGV